MSRTDDLRVKAKLLQKSKTKAGKPIRLKEAFEILARSAGYPSWRELKATLDEHDVLRPRKASAFWSTWYSRQDEARAHLADHGGYLLPYQRHYFICDWDYVASLGLERDDPDVVAVGNDWSAPRNKAAWKRLLAKISQKKV